jgi:omega-6 fatty acid desaturase (delta-12 desaturase)
MTAIAPTPREIRGVIPVELRRRSTAKGIWYFAISAVFYWTTFVMIALSQPWWTRVVLALVNGLAAGVLFVVGHDACHGSLTPRHTLNNWLGRLAFLPSLHPYSAWEYSHNAMHHGWTNLRGKDPVYCPLTIDEYRALPRSRQWLARASRSAPGMLLLYLVTIWWPLSMRPKGHHRQQIDKRGTYGFDRGIVLAFPLVQIAVLTFVARLSELSWAATAAICALGVAVPFATFTWLMGFATYQHHTHPRVIWYDDEDEWNFFRSQVQGTVHIVFPRWIEVLLHNIMEHTAHHVDMKVPLYHLTDAQRTIEAAFGEENVVTEAFSFRGISRTFRTCQLYDYRAHRWVSFAGVPTTEPRILGIEAGVTNSPPRILSEAASAT